MKKIVLLSTILVVAQSWAPNAPAASKCGYVAIARKAVHKVYPDYQFKRVAAIHDQGSEVTVDYPPPKDWVGGSPVVRIEKGTCRVLSVIRTQ